MMKFTPEFLISFEVKLIEKKKNTAGPSTEKLIESQSYIIA